MNATKIVFLVGAGISTNAGISDFKSTNGIESDTTKLSRDLFHRLTLEHDPNRIHRFVCEFLSKNYQPTKTHAVMKMLQDRGQLLAVLTQNIDGLEEKAGIARDKIIQLHGSVHSFRCCNPSCTGRLNATEYTLLSQNTSSAPLCYQCNGQQSMRPDILLYGEDMNEEITNAAISALIQCDLFVCVGTSLTVNPVASLPFDFLSNSSAIRVWINHDPPPFLYDTADFFQFVFTDDCDNAITSLFDAHDIV